MIHRTQDLLGFSAKFDPFAKFHRIMVEQGLVGLQVDPWISCFGEQPGGWFEIEILPVLEAEFEKAVIARLPLKMRHDLLSAPAQRWIVTADMGPQPLGGL